MIGWYKLVISTVIIKYILKICTQLNKRIKRNIMSVWEIIHKKRKTKDVYITNENGNAHIKIEQTP